MSTADCKTGGSIPVKKFEAFDLLRKWRSERERIFYHVALGQALQTTASGVIAILNDECLEIALDGNLGNLKLSLINADYSYGQGPLVDSFLIITVKLQTDILAINIGAPPGNMVLGYQVVIAPHPIELPAAA